MPDYSVDVQNVEEGEVRVSVTGTVDGVSVSATVMRDDLPKTKRGRVEAMERALVFSYRERRVAVSRGGKTVSVED